MKVNRNWRSYKKCCKKQVEAKKVISGLYFIINHADSRSAPFLENDP